MSVMLPGDLAWVLNLVGFNWPNIDEDKLRACAATDRNLAGRCDAAQTHAAAAVTIIATSNKGKAAEAFGAHGKKVSVHLGRLRDVYNVTAGALDAIADVVEGAKIAVVAQLGFLAGEIATAAAASIFTFGLSDALGLAATAVTRITVQQVLDEMERQVIKFVEFVAVGAAMGALLASVASLGEQATSDFVGTGHGISATAAAKAAGATAAHSV